MSSSQPHMAGESSLVMLPSLLVIANPFGGGGKAKGITDKLQAVLDKLYSPALGYTTTAIENGGGSNHSFSGGVPGTPRENSSNNSFNAAPTAGGGSNSDLYQAGPPEREEIQRNPAAAVRHPQRNHKLQILKEREAERQGGTNASAIEAKGATSAPLVTTAAPSTTGGPSIPITSLRPDAAMAVAAPGTYCFERTIAPNDGVRLATCGASLQFDIVVVIGGDGTLSEVINGVARGVCTADCIEGNRMSRQQLLGLCGSVSADTSPNILYLAAGTGGDFSRLGSACKNVEQVAEMIESFAHWEHQQQYREAQNNSGSNSGGSGRESIGSHVGGTRRHERPPKRQRVDVAFVRFMRTRTIRFFVNVCSAGLGYEVCARADRMKKPCSCLGGKAVFMGASAVELCAMDHKYISIRPWYADGSLAEIPKDTMLPQGKSAAAPLHISTGGGGNTSGGTSPVNSNHSLEGPDSTRHSDGSFTGVLEMGAPPAEKGQPLDGSTPPPGTSPTNNDAVGGSPSSQGPVNSNGVVSTGWYHTRATAAAFCNGQYFGGGMQVSPDASTQDQLLNLTIWREKFLGFLCGLYSVYNGKHVHWKSTSTMQATLYEVKATNDEDSEKVGFECDGELAGHLPAAIGIAGSVHFLVPPSDEERKAASTSSKQDKNGSSKFV